MIRKPRISSSIYTFHKLLITTGPYFWSFPLISYFFLLLLYSWLSPYNTLWSWSQHKKRSGSNLNDQLWKCWVGSPKAREREGVSQGKRGHKDLKRLYTGNKDWVNFLEMRVAGWPKEEQVAGTEKELECRHRYKKRPDFVSIWPLCRNVSTLVLFQYEVHTRVGMARNALDRLVSNHKDTWCHTHGVTVYQ